jgi:lysophospholipase L1-like esterase
VGVNGDPSGKVADFDADMRNGLASTVDVALMKFCYVDVTAGTDVQRLFQKYRDTLNGLSADYPQVRFVAVTVPLTVDSPADNVTRTRLNAMIRQAYPGRLFDLAAVESTRPDGTRVTGSAQGQSYEALHPGYSSDGGHLNPDGARRAAAEMLRVIARAPHAGS